MNPTLFDSLEAERLKAEGMSRAAKSNSHVLSQAQQIAFALGNQFPDVTSDTVALRMEQLGLRYESLGNAAGSVFKSEMHGKRWVWTGRVTSSCRVSTHKRIIRIWTLVEASS